MVLKDKTKKASKSARAEFSDGDVEELQSKDKAKAKIPSTTFESQLKSKVLDGICLCALIYNWCTLLLKDKTKKASKSARVSDGDGDVEELQFKVLHGICLSALIYNLCTLLLKDKTKKASKSATAELSDGDSDSDLLSREELLLKLKKVNKEKKALEKENGILRRNNIILQKGNWNFKFIFISLFILFFFVRSPYHCINVTKGATYEAGNVQQ